MGNIYVHNTTSQLHVQDQNISAKAFPRTLRWENKIKKTSRQIKAFFLQHKIHPVLETKQLIDM